MRCLTRWIESIAVPKPSVRYQRHGVERFRTDGGFPFISQNAGWQGKYDYSAAVDGVKCAEAVLRDEH